MKIVIKNTLLVALIVLISGLVLSRLALARPQNDEVVKTTTEADTVNYSKVNAFVDENEQCFKCHGSEYFQLTSKQTGESKKRMMCSNYIISRSAFYQANHKSFACLDCHSYDFEEFPHKVEGRLEDPYTCLDCHGYDENYAKYHFEEIQEEYDKSIHAQLPDFSCWKCHDPHSYKITVRTSTNLEQTIRYDNNICLKCHANYNNFGLLTNAKEIDLVKSHDWLPNQVAHFASIRCIECHTKINDTILVAHELLPKEQAVKRCTECHSSNSRLMETLYKFKSKEQRKSGFVNGVIINESYVIGANRNIYLNILSVAIFVLVLIVIGVHVAFRIIKSKNQ